MHAWEKKKESDFCFCTDCRKIGFSGGPMLYAFKLLLVRTCCPASHSLDPTTIQLEHDLDCLTRRSGSALV